MDKVWMFQIQERNKIGPLAAYKLIGHMAHKNCATFKNLTVSFTHVMGASPVTQNIQLFLCPDCDGVD